MMDDERWAEPGSSVVGQRKRPAARDPPAPPAVCRWRPCGDELPAAAVATAEQPVAAAAAGAAGGVTAGRGGAAGVRHFLLDLAADHAAALHRLLGRDALADRAGRLVADALLHVAGVRLLARHGAAAGHGAGHLLLDRLADGHLAGAGDHLAAAD